MGNTLRRYQSLLITAGLVGLVLIWMSGQYEPRIIAATLLSGLTLGALYFLVTSGLSLIFGLMDVLNFAHGLFFMLGAYFGYTLYANPRMILNTLPFMLAIGGGLAVGAWAVGRLRPLQKTMSTDRIVNGLVGLAGTGLALVGLWGFDLLALAANSSTSTGGAVATDQAQEPPDRYLIRVVCLAAAGLLFGVVMARIQTAESRTPGTGWRSLIGGGIALGIALVLITVRTSGETWVLGLSLDLRFVLALVFGALGGAVLGGLVEWSMIRPLYSRPIYQVLLTLGLVFIGTELVKGVWGPAGFFMEMPTTFNASGKGCPSPDLLAWFSNHCSAIRIMGRPFPSYRLFIIALGLVVFVAIAILLQRTRLGMIIRAGVQDSEMVQALGINVRRIFTLVFALGAGLAALGGVAAAPFVGVNPGLGQEFLLLAFIAVVIGGMGSYSGAALGALLVGLARAVGDQLVTTGVHLPWMVDALKFSPSIARASTVLLMALVLLLKPSGLFGRKE